MKKIIFTALCSMAIGMSKSQDVRDLVRYSETQVFGSARMEAMGGSFGALGADIGSSSINPAGFGRYSSSAFGLNMANTRINNNGTFNDQETETRLNSLKMNALGVVLVNDVSKRNNGWIYNQFGFTFNRVANFKDKINYSGQQVLSLTDYFASSAEGYNVTDMYSYLGFSSALAWDTYAIDPLSSSSYAPRLDAETESYQNRTLSTFGGMSEYNFNFSGNYNNKLYVGGNLGLRTLNYREENVHREYYINNSQSLDSINYTYNLKTKGSGSNFKLGIIYLPIEKLRIGLAIHTPTFFELKDEYNADMIAYHDSVTITIEEDYKPYGEYKYKLRTPARLTGSLAYIFGTRGCINIDLEYVNYDWAHLRSTSDENYAYFDYSTINKDARSQTRPVLNVRIGGELVFHSQYFVRGGIGYYPSAYDPKSLNIAPNMVYAGGLGFKWKNNTVDIAIRYDERKYAYYAFPESKADFHALRSSLILNYQLSF